MNAQIVRAMHQQELESAILRVLRAERDCDYKGMRSYRCANSVLRMLSFPHGVGSTRGKVSAALIRLADRGDIERMRPDRRRSGRIDRERVTYAALKHE